MPERPVIGITLDHDDERTRYLLPYHYVAAVAAAGGTAVLLPYAEGLEAAGQADVIDGLLLSGGNDVDPSAWGEERHPKAKPVDPTRESHERALLDEAQRRGMPVLCICFGMQVLNTLRGGSLAQHIPDLPGREEHRQAGLGWGRRHEIEVAEGSLLADACGGGRGGRMEVNTSHHQAIARLGEGLRVVARAPDGTIEAVEDARQPFLVGVQWHPERMAEEAPEQAALFAKLVEAAQAYGRAAREPAESGAAMTSR